VATETIVKAGVIKGDIIPSAGVVTVGALAFIVGRECCVAAGAVEKACVGNDRVGPPLGAVAVGAFARIVSVRGDVAGLAIDQHLMIDRDIQPILGIMAGGTHNLALIYRTTMFVITGELFRPGNPGNILPYRMAEGSRQLLLSA